MESYYEEINFDEIHVYLSQIACSESRPHVTHSLRLKLGKQLAQVALDIVSSDIQILFPPQAPCTDNCQSRVLIFICDLVFLCDQSPHLLSFLSPMRQYILKIYCRLGNKKQIKKIEV